MQSPKIDWRAEGMPKFVWPGSIQERRNRFVLFRLDFKLDSIPDITELMLFADTRYRLCVNGDFVSSGPARFVTQFPEYDRFEIHNFLQQGDNCVTVEVNFFGASSYQTMPDGKGGFVAWGKAGKVSFDTPGDWKMKILDAWDACSALFSFAQNPVESVDTRKLEPSWFQPGSGDLGSGWENAQEVPLDVAPWGKLAPRTAPVLRFPMTRPRHVLAAGPLANDEDIYGFRLPDEEERTSRFDIDSGGVAAFETWIEAPEDMTDVPLGMFWGDFWLNGERIEAQIDKSLCNRSTAHVSLKKGWNRFAGYLEHLTQPVYWDLLIGIPRDRGLRVAASKEAPDNGFVFRRSPTVPKAEVEQWIQDGKPLERDGWYEVDGSHERLTPARVTGWDHFADEGVVRDLPASEVRMETTDLEHVWVFKLDAEFLGHVVIDIDAPAGTVVDVGFDEWLRADGMIDLYRTNPFVNTVERFITRGGRQRLQGFHPRGGRYLQVTIRKTDASPLTIHDIHVLETRTILGHTGRFECNDKVFNDVWLASVQTLIGSTEDAYADSPWRERGTYVGDFWVNQPVHSLLEYDPRSARRAIRVYAQSQMPDGQIQCVAPAWLRKPHEDFTLIWILALRDHWALTGDTSLIKEVWPALHRVWKSSAWHPDAQGLWHMNDHRVFIDWGVNRPDRQGFANGVVNALRVAALRASAQLAEQIGLTEEQAAFEKEAERVRTALCKALWMPEEQRFAAALDEDRKPVDSPARHANIVMWAYDLAEEDQKEALQAYVFKTLERNFEAGLAEGQFGGHIELYFFVHVLGTLADRGEHERAEVLIRQHWGFLVEDGFGTLPECFCRFDIGAGSRCHSWSGFPAVYMHRYVLGLRQLESGNPLRWVVEPRVSDEITSAKGVMPTPRGDIEVSWQREENGEIRVSINAPEGIEVNIGDALAHHA